MRLKKQDKFHKILSVLALIFWCFLIFYFSNQRGSISESSSNHVIYFIDNFFKFLGLKIDISSYQYISFVVRKLAHMFLYFVLYFLSFYVMYQFKIEKRRYLAIFFCFFYAISDEVHQLFIPNRSGLVIDVFIDTLGAFFANFFLSLMNKVLKTCK